MKILKRLLQISWRNVLRHRRRSLFTLVILVLGSTGLILMGGFFNSLTREFREMFIHSQTGHLQVSAKGYYEKGTTAPFDYLIEDVSKLENLIETNPHVFFSVPYLKLNGMVSSADTSIAAIVLGVDSQKEYRMTHFSSARGQNQSTRILEGKGLSPDNPFGAILGQGLKKSLGLKVGDSFNFLTTRQAGAIDGAEYQLLGTFQTFVKDFDDRAMKIPLTSAQNLLGTLNQVHSLLVVLDKTENTDLVKKELSELFKKHGLDLEIITWFQQGHFYRQSVDLLGKIYAIVQFIVAIIFLISIANTINMTVFERMREFGTMMAIGNDRWIISATIIFEAMILGLLGAFFGILIGSGISEIVSFIGIPMPPPPQGTTEYTAYIALSPKLLGQTFLIATLSTWASAIHPAYRASHFPIIQALGYV